MVLGEIHDNPEHHRVQAAYVAALAPKALVFEMIAAPEAAAAMALDKRDRQTLKTTLVWTKSGWPDFALYWPIFAAAPGAAIVGAAVPRDTMRQAMQDGAAAAFGPEADRYGLTTPLSPDDQSARETLQAEAHCNALPPEMVPAMVEAQRLRDAAFARSALQALETYGAPVAVITGSGHARTDWGIPAALALAAPEIRIASLGQAEGAPDLDQQPYDLTLYTDPIDRPDPCAAFQ